MLIPPLALIHVLDDLEQFAKLSDDDIALQAVTECRTSLQKLVVKMDSLEVGFDRIAERSRKFTFLGLHCDG